MKRSLTRWIRAVMAGVFTLLFQGLSASETTPRPVIAVLDFGAVSTSAGDATVVSSFVRQAVVNDGGFVVVDQANMERILAEQAFQQTGCTNQECAVKLGKILNAQKIVVGNFALLGGIHYLTAQLVDVETAKIVRTAKEKGFSLGNADRAAEKLTAELLRADATKSAKPAKTKKTRPGAFARPGGSQRGAGLYVWEGFEHEINWDAEQDSAATGHVVSAEHVSEGSRSLELAFTSVAESGRAVFSREQDLDWSPYGALILDVHNATDLENLRFAVVIVTLEREIAHEAISEPLRKGWNRDVMFDLTAPIYETAASDFEPVGYLVGRGDVREILFQVYPGEAAKGSVFLDNVRLERTGIFTYGDLAVNSKFNLVVSVGDVGYVSPDIRLRDRDIVSLESFEDGSLWATDEDEVVIDSASDLKSAGRTGLSVSFPASPDGFDIEMTGMEDRLAGTAQLWVSIYNAGRDVSVALLLVDGEGDEYESERRKLKHGWNTLLFDFSNANDWAGAVIDEGVLGDLDDVILNVESRYAGRIVIDGLSGGDLALRGTSHADALVSVSYNPHEDFEFVADTRVDDIFYGARLKDTRDAGVEAYLDGAVMRADVANVRSRVLYRRKIKAFDNPVKSFVSQNSLGTELAAVETSGRYGRTQMQAVLASQLEYDRYNRHNPTGFGPLALAGARVRCELGDGWRAGTTWVGQRYRYGRGVSGMPLWRDIFGLDLDSYTQVGEGSLWWGVEGAVAKSAEEQVSTSVSGKEPYYIGTSLSPQLGRISMSYRYDLDGYHFGGNSEAHWGGVELSLDDLPVIRLLSHVPFTDGSLARDLAVGASGGFSKSRDRYEDAITGKLEPRYKSRLGAFTIGNDYKARPNFYVEIEAIEEESPWYRTPSILETVSIRMPLPLEVVISAYLAWEQNEELDKFSQESGKGWKWSHSLNLERYFVWNLYLNFAGNWYCSRQSWEREWGRPDYYFKFSAMARQTVGSSTSIQLNYGSPALFSADYGIKGTIDVWTLTLSSYF